MDNNSFILDLKKMLNYCSVIKELLETDKTHFIQNNIEKITESNQKKIELLSNLNNLRMDIDNDYLSSYSGEFLEKIASHIKSFDESNEWQFILESLKIEIDFCYKFIEINGQLVSKTSQQLKTIWDQLVMYKTNIDGLYDHTGNTVSI